MQLHSKSAKPSLHYAARVHSQAKLKLLLTKMDGSVALRKLQQALDKPAKKAKANKPAPEEECL